MRCSELLKQISLRYECECNRLLSEYDLTLSQLELQHFLFTQQEKGIPVNQRSIEEMLHLKNPTVTGILKRLESKGFVVRVNDPAFSIFSHADILPYFRVTVRLSRLFWLAFTRGHLIQ